MRESRARQVGVAIGDSGEMLKIEFDQAEKRQRPGDEQAETCQEPGNLAAASNQRREREAESLRSRELADVAQPCRAEA